MSVCCVLCLRFREIVECHIVHYQNCGMSIVLNGVKRGKYEWWLPSPMSNYIITILGGNGRVSCLVDLIDAQDGMEASKSRSV